VERNGDGGVKVKLYLPFRYTAPPNEDSPLNGVQIFHVVSMNFLYFPKIGVCNARNPPVFSKYEGLRIIVVPVCEEGTLI
jgi:hypothetical protein